MSMFTAIECHLRFNVQNENQIPDIFLVISPLHHITPSKTRLAFTFTAPPLNKQSLKQLKSILSNFLVKFIFITDP